MEGLVAVLASAFILIIHTHLLTTVSHEEVQVVLGNEVLVFWFSLSLKR